jgi:hypothetical protein
MKKVALVISLFALIFAFTVSTVSAQKVTSAEKAKTEKVVKTKGNHAKSCASKSAACTSKEGEHKACCNKSAATGVAPAAEGEAKSGCSKSCSKAEGKGCCKKGEAKTDVAPVPKQN